MKRSVALILISASCAASVISVEGYLKLGARSGTRTLTLRWQQFPVRYFVTNSAASGVSAQQLQTAAARAFETWHAVESAETSAEFAGFVASPPRNGDGISVLGFLSRPDQESVLGATSFLYDTTDGEILEVDIFFNSAFLWSVASGGETGRFDVESIALHEIGHLFGLGHSALGETEVRPGGRRVLSAEAVMFPVAFSAGTVEGRTLRADDIAGISDIYPTTEFTRAHGSISGRVTKNGTGVFGAHLTAFHLQTGKLIGGFTLNTDGTYTIGGLEAGPHVLRVEPLDDGNLESFFDATQDVDLDFRVKFHDRVVPVPEGGGVRNIDIRVVPK